jgi:ATP-dependent helicase Lhr and Lhr-like helicase
LRLWELLRRKGACFAEEIQRSVGLSSIEVQYALWELAAAGLAAADGFDQLRAMIDPDRRHAANSSYRKVRSAAGRWSLFRADSPTPIDAIEQARYEDLSVESAAFMLLNRYGVVFRDLLVFESNIPRWGILQRMLRRLEDRGQVRGGRFVSGFGGEQFALPEVPGSLRETRNQALQQDVTLAGADPLNLVGILIPGERIPAVAGRTFVLTSKMLEQSASFPSRPLQGSQQRFQIRLQSKPARETRELQTRLI